MYRHVLDSEDLQKISLNFKSLHEAYHAYNGVSVPLPDRQGFLVILVLYGNSGGRGLEVRKFHLEDGHVTISQPEFRLYTGTFSVLTDQEAGKIFVIGKLTGSENSKYGINIYTTDTDIWTFNYLESAPALDDIDLYTISFPIFT